MNARQSVGDILNAMPLPDAGLEMLVDDVTTICQRVPYIEVAPAAKFSTGLISELASASDRLAAKVADLQERQGASR